MNIGQNSFDVIIAGGGVMGCATAYYLLKMNPGLQVAIVEKDPTYRYASTILSDGNVRIQFNLKENIQISQYGNEILATFAEDMAVGEKVPHVAARRQGNLFLADENGRTEAELGLKLQQSLGCQVEWLSAAQIKAAYPTYQIEGCVGGTLGREDGSVDPNAVLMGYKDKATALGAHYIQAEVAELLTDVKQVSGVRLASGDILYSSTVLSAAGAWARGLALTAGVDLPVQPVMRQVHIVETPFNPDGFLPSLFLPTGLYLIHENAGHFVIGKSLPDDPVGFDFSVQQQRFIDLLWPELIEYLPAFERLKVTGGWAGLYAVNTLDGNAILGEWPEMDGLYLANGFSGHGFQQCHAVGRYLAEMILGLEPALDLSVFTPERILENKPIFESTQRLI
jgi:glycine/D-amino acid oxidase-like deaminating enzyme